MELALAGRDQVDVGVCSVLGWGRCLGRVAQSGCSAGCLGEWTLCLFVGRSERRGASVSAGTRSEVRPRSPPQRIELLLPAGRVPPQRIARPCIVVSALLARLCRPFVDMIRRKKGDRAPERTPTRGPKPQTHPPTAAHAKPGPTSQKQGPPTHSRGRQTHRGRKQTRRNEQTGDDRRHATRRPLTRGSSDNVRTDETQTNAPED